MPRITITKEASDLIRAHATLPFRDTGRPLGNGMVEVPIDDEVYHRLVKLTLKGETVADTLIRLFAIADGKANN